MINLFFYRKVLFIGATNIFLGIAFFIITGSFVFGKNVYNFNKQSSGVFLPDIGLCFLKEVKGYF